jgi:phospholipase C
VTTAVYPNCPDKLFQFHHQPFAYFSRYAPGTGDRATHLKDEVDFVTAARAGTLPAVSFVKPVGEDNEHPGYTSEHSGSRHLVDLLQAIESGPDADSTLVVVTYDEFGGQWDHVSPPGQGSRTPGPFDRFGPGTRIPALIVGAPLRRSTVDHTSYDTTSIIATIERQHGLPPLTPRAARVNVLRLASDD